MTPPPFGLSPKAIDAGGLFEALKQDGPPGLAEGFTYSERESCLAIFRFLRGRPLRRALEVGLGIGGSATHILAGMEGSLVSMDPMQSEFFKNAGLRNLEAAGMQSRVEFHEESSRTALPRLLQRGEAFDFVYVDGDHSFETALSDMVFAARLLAPGGYLLLDDTNMHPVRRVARLEAWAERGRLEICDNLYREGMLFRRIQGVPR